MIDDSVIDRIAAGDKDIPGSILATPEQDLVERRALEIYQRPEIARARERLLALFRADRNALLADQEAFILQSADEHCLHAALIAASETPRSPGFVWTLALPHNWLGRAVPGSRMGQENPDNIYRFASVDPGLSYRISGRFHGRPPTDFSLCSLPAQVGEGIAADVRGIITPDTLDVDGDGRFEILVDATPTQARRNHLCIAGARVLMGRDTLGDWGREGPAELHIERMDGDAVDDFDIERAAPRAAGLVTDIGEFFLTRVQHGMCEAGPLNSVPAPESSAGRGGLTTQTGAVGYYRLGQDEALVLSLDPLGARYLGVQICDMWMLSYDYSRHTSSFNHRQALADGDGRIRLVIAAEDPGVHNWLDGSGNSLGSLVLRWQCVPAGADFSGAVAAEVVDIGDLPSYLPAGTRYLDRSGREAQRAERFREYLRRVHGHPEA